MFESHFGVVGLCQELIGFGRSQAPLGKVIRLILNYRKQLRHVKYNSASYTE